MFQYTRRFTFTLCSTWKLYWSTWSTKKFTPSFLKYLLPLWSGISSAGDLLPRSFVASWPTVGLSFTPLEGSTYSLGLPRDQRNSRKMSGVSQFDFAWIIPGISHARVSRGIVTAKCFALAFYLGRVGQLSNFRGKNFYKSWITKLASSWGKSARDHAEIVPLSRPSRSKDTRAIMVDRLTWKLPPGLWRELIYVEFRVPWNSVSHCPE